MAKTDKPELLQEVISRLQLLQISFFCADEDLMSLFNEYNGLNKLVELLKLSDWKVKALALDTIPKLYNFQSTIAYIQQNSQILIIMWE